MFIHCGRYTRMILDHWLVYLMYVLLLGSQQRYCGPVVLEFWLIFDNDLTYIYGIVFTENGLLLAI